MMLTAVVRSVVRSGPAALLILWFKPMAGETRYAKGGHFMHAFHVARFANQACVRGSGRP